MKLYKVKITPTSTFGTSLKGDTLFGQMCWAIRYTFGEKKLESLLLDYANSPFLVVSDGFLSGYLPKPTMPMSLLGEDGEKKKENRKKIWLTLDELQKGDFAKARTDKKLNNKKKTKAIVKNSLNHQTFRTDDSGAFAPYAEEETDLSAQDIYFLIDESRFKVEELKQAFIMLSKMGYGKNSSIGKGFFELGDFEEIKFKNGSKTFMTLSPSVLFEEKNIHKTYYEPFTRFGKHGAGLANTNPFKKPILMADSGAVVIFEDTCTKDYIGKAINKHSSHSKTVHQGYSIVLPINKEFKV